ncbi:MAG: hypothetical protein ATN34_00520 [Epulopiscium sp. Nele67-Bin002]|nr:MAG: hypothetical protein ATN34_00520 [Epulopiscium sp. Nele67-Bin002]
MEEYLKDELNLLYNEHEAVVLMDAKNQTYKIIFSQKNYFQFIPLAGHWKELFAYEFIKFPQLEAANVPQVLLNRAKKKIYINLESDKEKYYLTLIYLAEKDQYLCFIDEIYNVNQLQHEVTQNTEKQYENTRLVNMLTVFARNLFFRYEPITKLFTFYEDILLIQPSQILSVKEILESDLVQPDKDIFMQFIAAMDVGKVESAEFRMKFKQEQYNWYRVHYEVNFNEDNTPVTIFGIIKNIDAEVKYKNKSECDLLTGLYNKLTSEKKIDHLLREGNLATHSYLIFIDVDNFKAVNDNLGHNFGDTVLINLAKNLKTIFRKEDVVGRIGGDEFMVFVKNLDSEITLIERLEEVKKAFHNVYYDVFTEHEISSSIGVSMYPRDGHTFKDMAEKADIAMYRAKKQGKNQYIIYDHSWGATVADTVVDHFDAMKRTSSQFIDIELCFNLFELLYNVDDVLIGLNKIISIIGNSYDIDRFYIFRVDHALGLHLNQFEWINEKAAYLPYMPYTISTQMVKPITDMYDEGGIFYFDSSMEFPQEFWDAMPYSDIKSMLHCSMKIEDQVSITLGFDRYYPQMKWNQKTINTLIFLAKIISIYVC